MLTVASRVFIYVVARDFGFAPNPFHGTCTLATCKPRIRASAREGDWVVGMGGAKLKAVGRCIFAMRVTRTMSFDDYWSDAAFLDKRPVRNGSRRMMLGDNIYHRQGDGRGWHQADSHHSRPDGSADPHNVERDTSADRVLVSSHFYYFGNVAPLVPAALLECVGYRNCHGHRVFPMRDCSALVDWLESTFASQHGLVSGLPFQFGQSGARYSAGSDKIL